MTVHTGEPVGTAGPALGEGTAAMIMVHGRGASAPSILELARVFGHPGVSYLAPSAANHTWSPNSFMAPQDANEPHLSSALDLLARMLDQVVSAGIPRERTFILGFSQGACLASEFVMRNPGRYGGLIAYSGGLIGPEGSTWDPVGEMEGTPVFLGCSDVDAHIPVSRVHETEEVFQAMGAQVEKRIYPGMGHLVNRDEIAYTQELLSSVPAS